MDKKTVSETLIFVGFTLGILLPARMLFSTFVSDYWIGNLGLVTAIGIVLLFLARKNKLGKIGRIFEKYITKMTSGRTSVYVLVVSMLFLVYFGYTMVLIEKGNTIYYDDKELLHSLITDNNNHHQKELIVHKLDGPAVDKNLTDTPIFIFFVVEYAFSITYSMMDEMAGGWISHLYSILFVEQIEIVLLVLFFRWKKKEELKDKNNAQMEQAQLW